MVAMDCSLKRLECLAGVLSLLFPVLIQVGGVGGEVLEAEHSKRN